MDLFCVTYSLFFSFFVKFGYRAVRHNQIEVELRPFIEIFQEEHLKTDFLNKETSA